MLVPVRVGVLCQTLFCLLLTFIILNPAGATRAAARSRVNGAQAGAAPSRAAAGTLTRRAFLPLIFAGQTGIQWGAQVAGNTYGSGYGDAPWDMNTLARFEQSAGRQVSIVHWGQGWYYNGAYYGFSTTPMNNTYAHGATPLLDWSSTDLSNSNPSQPQFLLSTIIAGVHDSYIRQFANDAKNWGHPVLLRFDHEMNGWWFGWSEQSTGNLSGQYAQAWRHVHDIFVAAGAINVKWVWCPNVEQSGTTALEGLYPGDTYVDWTCMDGYNWGTNPSHPYGWISFYDRFAATYTHLRAIAPSKPIMIGETASTEYGGSKAGWITDALQTQLPQNFPAIKAVVWSDRKDQGLDWPIESSGSAKNAFAVALTSGYFH